MEEHADAIHFEGEEKKTPIKLANFTITERSWIESEEWCLKFHKVRTFISTNFRIDL